MFRRGLSITLVVVCFLFAACHRSGKDEPRIFQERGAILVHAASSGDFRDKESLLSLIASCASPAAAPTAPSKTLIAHPYDRAVFPRDIASPQFSWQSADQETQFWLLSFSFTGSDKEVHVLTDKQQWAPERWVWETIKKYSLEKNARAVILGVTLEKKPRVTEKGVVTFTTSSDEVGAPILYQQMPLPITFSLNHPEQFKWLLGDVSSYRSPRVVLENQRVCGMCHHVSLDGKTFGLDLDVNQDKGAYALSPVTENIILQDENIISWTEFQNDDAVTLGLFSKISPRGKYVISTIKERRIFITMEDLRFSELFFPFSGLLACFATASNTFFFLPGADDPDYVHVAPSWRPDGREIVFSRAPVNRKYFHVMQGHSSLKAKSSENIQTLNKKYPIKYELYTLPFHDGKGGVPKHLPGANVPGKSNYWARYSPDGRWIVYTQSDNALMNQPGSELFIIPATGGKARKMQCSRNGHNSWHSWSPNGRWLVFSSKVNTPFTEIFLAHVDADGNDSQPVLLSRFSSPRMASVLPEFANISPQAMKKIRLY